MDELILKLKNFNKGVSKARKLKQFNDIEARELLKLIAIDLNDELQKLGDKIDFHVNSGFGRIFGFNRRTLEKARENICEVLTGNKPTKNLNKSILYILENKEIKFNKRLLSKFLEKF